MLQALALPLPLGQLQVPLGQLQVLVDLLHQVLVHLLHMPPLQEPNHKDVRQQAISSA